MADYIEGRRAVEEALRAGVPIRYALVQAGATGSRKASEQGKGRKGPQKPQQAPEQGEGSLDGLVERLRAASIEVRVVDRATLDRISRENGSHGAHQGIVCEVPPFGYADVADVVARAADKPASLVIACDHITDEGNLGAIIRTAEVIGADGVIIPSKRAAQVTAGVYKTSAGAVLHLPIARVPNLVAALETLKREGFWVAGASEHATQDIWHAPLEGRVVLVAGSEGEGISRLVRESCDFLAALPQAGHVGSLNVAQATTAICYEWLRRTMTRAD